MYKVCLLTKSPIIKKNWLCEASITTFTTLRRNIVEMLEKKPQKFTVDCWTLDNNGTDKRAQVLTGKHGGMFQVCKTLTQV